MIVKKLTICVNGKHFVYHGQNLEKFYNDLVAVEGVTIASKVYDKLLSMLTKLTQPKQLKHVRKVPLPQYVQYRF